MTRIIYVFLLRKGLVCQAERPRTLNRCPVSLIIGEKAKTLEDGHFEGRPRILEQNIVVVAVICNEKILGYFCEKNLTEDGHDFTSVHLKGDVLDEGGREAGSGEALNA